MYHIHIYRKFGIALLRHVHELATAYAFVLTSTDFLIPEILA